MTLIKKIPATALFGLISITAGILIEQTFLSELAVLKIILGFSTTLFFPFLIGYKYRSIKPKHIYVYLISVAYLTPVKLQERVIWGIYEVISNPVGGIVGIILISIIFFPISTFSSYLGYLLSKKRNKN